MNTYKIPFSYQTNAVAKIRAFTMEEAVLCVNKLVNTNTSALQNMAVSVSIDDTTYKIDRDRIDDLNPDKTFTVKVRRVSVAQIEVKASDTSSAENKVEEMMAKGDLPDLQWQINLERIESVVEL